jgi:cytochrome c oxidase cbb3-type subunit III
MRREACLALALAFNALAGCRREERRFSGTAYGSGGAAGVRIDGTGGAPMPAADTTGPYDGNAWAMGEGQRLWSQMNCSGCHFHGGGGMGPPLMDGKWRYGAGDGAIFATIVGGRPNGMPAFRGRLSDDQVWQLVAYVKSLSGRASPLAAGVRDDHMSVRPGPSRTDPEPISKEEP